MFLTFLCTRQLLAFGYSPPLFDQQGNLLSDTYQIEFIGAKEDYVHPLHPEFSEKDMKVNRQLFILKIIILFIAQIQATLESPKEIERKCCF